MGTQNDKFYLRIETTATIILIWIFDDSFGVGCTLQWCQNVHLNVIQRTWMILNILKQRYVDIWNKQTSSIRPMNQNWINILNHYASARILSQNQIL